MVQIGKRRRKVSENISCIPAGCPVHAHSTWEAKTGRSLRVWGHPGLHSEFYNSWSFTVRPCLKKNLVFRKKEVRETVEKRI